MIKYLRNCVVDDDGIGWHQEGMKTLRNLVEFHTRTIKNLEKKTLNKMKISRKCVQ